MTERAAYRESLRPTIACILRDRAAAIPFINPSSEWYALHDGAATLDWVDACEAVEVDDERDAQIAELRGEVDQRDDEIDALKRELAKLKAAAKP